MIIRRFVVGRFQTNCYLLVCPETRQALVIDPGFADDSEALSIMDEVKKHRAEVKYIVNTHWHPDHTSGDWWLKKATGASILIHKDDASMLSETVGFEDVFSIQHKPIVPDATLTDGIMIISGKIILKVLHTPGHTRGSVSLLNRLTVFTGDTLFAGSIGRTDLPGGSFKEIIKSIRMRLMALPEETKIYPGHGPFSSIARERETNPFLKTIS